MRYYHSPFCETTPFSSKNKALILSFALSELFSYATDFKVSSLDPLKEHVALLFIAFPHWNEPLIEIKEKIAFLVYLDQKELSFPSKEELSTLFLLFEPLIKECHQDENFVFFLLSQYDKMDTFLDCLYLPSLLSEFYPDLAILRSHLCDYFHKKGFTRRLPEITFFLSEIEIRTPL